MHLERVIRNRIHAARNDGERHEGQLQIRMLNPGTAADEAAGLEMIGRGRHRSHS